MKRYLIASIVSVVIAIPTLFVVVIPLAILNIYLAGHNITWQDAQVFTVAGEAMTWLDVILWGATAAVSLSAGGLYLWVIKKREDSEIRAPVN